MSPVSFAEIQALDTDDETWYILRRPGKEPLVAHWPQPLEKLCPEAVRVAAYPGGDERRTAPFTVALSWNKARVRQATVI